MSDESPMAAWARLSDCGHYRYELGRAWDYSKPAVCFVMLNPSTADADRDDATIRRCNGFARSLGCGQLVVINLFAFRATNPRELESVADPVGGGNLAAWRRVLSQPLAYVICAWGAAPIVGKTGRGSDAWNVIRSYGHACTALRVTKGGAPEHPLRLPRDLRPAAYPPAQP